MSDGADTVRGDARGRVDARVRFERVVRQWWAGEYGALGDAARVAVAPLSWAYASLATRRIARRSGEHTVGVPVVSVGNLAVGGTGKTPLVGWLVEEAIRHGLRPGVVTHVVARDEAALVQTWSPSAIVVSDADRVRAAQRVAGQGADVVVLDDGFQHTRLRRSLDIVTLSASDPFPGATLPGGPYREPPSALARADLVVVTHREGCEEAPAGGVAALEPFLESLVPPESRPRVARAVLRPTGFRALDASTDSVDLSGASVLACAGVARPEIFFRAVSGRVGSVEAWPFPDHHAFDRTDALGIEARANGRPILITEKDAVKLKPFAPELGAVFVLQERMDWIEGEDRLRAQLHRLFQEVGP